jgi:hypothetical protein
VSSVEPDLCSVLNARISEFLDSPLVSSPDRREQDRSPIVHCGIESNRNEPESMNKRVIKRFLVGAAGGIVLAAGFAMIVLPGPAIVVIPLGLAILAIEFAWAKRWLEKVKRIALKAKRTLEKKKKVS